MNEDLAGRHHWDTRQLDVARRPPSMLNVGVGDIVSLLKRDIRPGCKVLEVGCTPGKFLLWCALVAKAEACGVEYAPLSAQATERLFADMKVPLDLRVEDFMQTSFEPGSFDLVYSLGVIEHLVDPAPMVRKHVELLKPGGHAIILIPNYGGIYGRIQQRIDPENVAIHNTSIMSVAALNALAPIDIPSDVQTFTYGRITPWILSLDKRMPTALARIVSLGVNTLGLLQPFAIDAVAPWLILRITRR